jgi:hypothetical protein
MVEPSEIGRRRSRGVGFAGGATFFAELAPLKR